MRTTARFAVLALAGALAAPVAAPLAAQPTFPSTPSITTMGTGEVKISPDRATLLAAVESRGRTAAEAGAANATTQTRVIAALRALAQDPKDISTVGYTVQPEYKYDANGGGRPQVVGYVARNTVKAELRNVELAGRAIDAALGAGANRIAGLNFYASNQDQARRDALGVAVASACRDAEAMAQAAGGSLASLLEVQAMPFDFPGPRPMFDGAVMARAAAAEETPVEAGDVTVRVQVNARFAFGPSGAAGVRCK